MKMNNFIWASALCAAMSFSFIACSEDDENNLNVPEVAVTKVSFTDENPEAIKISGSLSWQEPASVEFVTKYVIYASSGSTKDVKVGEVPVGTNTFTITDLPNLGYLLVFAANADGESAVCSSVRVYDQGGRGLLNLYFLNSGKNESNNSSLTRYDVLENKLTQDFFKKQNGRGLGDTAQDMIVYGDKMYISVYGESTIEVTDLYAKSIKQIKTDGKPRYLVADGGKVYVTYYNGYVARLDTTSLTVETTVKVGRNPEQLAVSNNKLYVANSGGMDWSTPTGYDKTVSVIDLPTFKETKKLEVVLNPVNVQADQLGNVYVISKGNYNDILNTFQRIDSKVDTISVVKDCSNVTEMAYNKGLLYMFYSQWNNGQQTPTFLTYNTETQTVGDSFIKDETKIKKPFYIFATGVNVFVTESDYTNDGDVYAFGKDGKQIGKYEAGLNPMKVVLVYK